MEVIVFIGIPASGKSSFYKSHFFQSHLPISLDKLNTRNKEQRFVRLGLNMQMPLVIDNTNVSRKERSKYITVAKAAQYKVIGC